MSRNVIYSQDYIKMCFDAWYLAGRPQQPAHIKEIIPIHERTGKKPSVPQIRRWVVQGAWDAWADDLDAKAITLADEGLINKKAEMLKRHQIDAEAVAKKALDHLKKDGFDSSSAAVQAYFKATEEQRKTAGFSDLLEKLDKLSNNEVEREIISRFNRIKENDQIIEVDSEDIPELEDAEE